MKKILFVFATASVLLSCNQLEEKINETITKATETAQRTAEQKTRETIEKTVSETFNTITNSQDAVFHEMFPNADAAMISDFKGKKVNLPNGSTAYVFKYKADREILLPFLEAQTTSDETKSDAKARKIDGQKFLNKISLLEKFIPENTIDLSFLDEIRNNPSAEFYRLKRFPNNSTLIYNPKSHQVFHFVEVEK